MLKKIKIFSAFCLLFITFSPENLSAQLAKYQEYGFWLGTSNYFGDLNPNYNFKTIRPAGGVFYKYSVGPYISLKGGVSYGSLNFDDKHSSDPFPSTRNLSFRSNVFEGAFQVEFNFLKYIPGDKNNFFSPYLTLGLSVFRFNPQAKYEGDWYNLRDLGTEGQQNGDFTNGEPYKLTQFAVPVGLGYKHWVSNLWNVGFEAGYRFTFTDYLDDISGTFVNPNILGQASVTAELADRSDELGTTIGFEGRQRGDSVSNDGYLFIGIFVTYTIFKGNCPQK